jgi:hypothetical protein
MPHPISLETRAGQGFQQNNSIFDSFQTAAVMVGGARLELATFWV